MQCSSAQQQYQADNQAPGLRNKGRQMITIATISIAAFTFFIWSLLAVSKKPTPKPQMNR
jgi:hypothetical protein